ncbi:MAG: WD40 repeat domain-containing protein [Anaerolineales bacterium]|nr:WD40 repeat domain-containing protein [Anaerolineales bacterium]
MSRPRSFVLLPLIAFLLVGWNTSSAKSSAGLDRLPVGEAQSTGYPLLAELHGQNASLLALAISPDGALLAASGDKGAIDLWTVADWQPAGSLTGHTAGVNTLAFSPDGARLASGSDDATVRVWDLSTLTELSRFKPTMATNVYRVAFSPSGTELAVGAQLCVVQLVNPGNGILRRTLDQPGCGATSLGWVWAWGIDYFPDGDGLITGDGRGCCGGALFRWAEDRFIEPELLAGYGLPVNDVDVDGSGTRVALSALGEPAVWIRDTVSGDLIHEMIGHVFRVNAVAYSPDGKLVASVSRDGTLVLWDTETGTEASRISPRVGPLTDVAFTPDGRLIAATTEDGRVLVWDLSGG